MSIISKQIDVPVVDLPSILYTSTPGFKSIGASGASAITTMYLYNSGALPVPVNIHLVPAGIYDPRLVAGPETIIYKNILIQPDDTYVVDTERFILDNGDQIHAYDMSGVGVSSVYATLSFIGI